MEIESGGSPHINLGKTETELPNGGPGPTADSCCPLQILLAEDNDDLRWVLSMALREDGHHVVEVRDGVQLLDEVEAPGGRTPANVIVSDQSMPGLTGLQVLSALRDAHRTIPFVLLTGSYDNDELVSEARRLGAVVMAKPFDLEALRASVCGRRTTSSGT